MLRPLLALLVAAATLLGCGHEAVSPSSLDQKPGQAHGTIVGQAFASLPQCSSLPGCGEAPFAMVLAVVKLSTVGAVESVTNVQTDASGHFRVEVLPGTYSYALAATPGAKPGLTPLLVPPFVVKSGQTVVQDVHVNAGQPPISIGVGN